VSVDEDLAAAGLPPLPRTAWLAIDLDRIAGNLTAIRRAIPASVRVEPVVKADGYGHGAVAVAWALEAAGADGLGVATWDEAIQLRSAGIRLPIIVLYPVPPSVALAAADLGVTLTAGDETLLARMLASWRASRSEPRSGSVPGAGSSDAARPLRLELEIETGLGRSGFPPDALPAAMRSIAATPGVEIVGAWTHLGSPDDARRTATQVAAFETARRHLATASLPTRHDHLAATGGLLADVGPLHDAVRPGLATYGVLPDGLAIATAREGLASDLRPAMELHARPVRVTDLPTRTGVSYGSAFVTSRPSRIATLPIGYADGYQRVRTNRAHALVRGVRVPLVGTIAMDAVMVDVTDVPGPPVTVDDAFVLLGALDGRTIDAAELALHGTTIAWEVLAGMARRVPRVYYAAARPVGVRTLTDERGPWQNAQPTTIGEGRRSSGERPPS
jgi:alanine racemase